MPKRIALVACVAKKRGEPCPASELYESPLFRKASSYARSIADEWYILSARYGLIAPSTVIEPYNQTLNQMSKVERLAWAERVLETLRPHLKASDEVIFLAGKNYRADLIRPIRELGCTILVPMEGMRIGEQLSWLGTHGEQTHAG